MAIAKIKIGRRTVVKRNFIDLSDEITVERDNLFVVADCIKRCGQGKSYRTVRLDKNVTLDFVEASGGIAEGHNAFLVSKKDFDETFRRLRKRRL